MKFRTVLILATLLLGAPFVSAQTRIYQRGTVVRMKISRCLASGGLLASLSGTSQSPGDDCPEYTLVSERVVYTVVGKSSNQLIPLAEDIEFRLVKNEILVKVDDEKRESRLLVKEMSIRSDWERDREERQRIQRAHQDRGNYLP